MKKLDSMRTVSTLLNPPFIPLGTHVWINASAGSGKTKRIVDRLIQLVLEDIPLSSVLCVSFTNTAATEITERLHSKLYALCSMDDTSLHAILREFVSYPTVHHSARIKRLKSPHLWRRYAQFHVSTIHSLCQRLLLRWQHVQQWGATFEILEEKRANIIWEQAKTKVLHAPSETVQRALDFLAQHLTDTQFATFANDLFQVRRFLKETQPGSPVYCEMPIPFVAPPLDSEQESALPLPWKEALRAAAQGEVAALVALCFTKDKKPRKRILASAIEKNFPYFTEYATKVQASLETFLRQQEEDLRKMWQWAWCTLGTAIMMQYHTDKEHHLDYEDLLRKAFACLSDQDGAELLEAGFGNIAHILVDEAQDTNAQQWDILIRMWDILAEIRPGHPPFWFIVGDAKQTIFSFQGSSLSLFDTTQKSLMRHTSPWCHVHLTHSYRAAPKLLQVVDSFLTVQEKYQGTGDTEGFLPFLPHMSAPSLAHIPGEVVLWPLCPASSPQEAVPWSLPKEKGEIPGAIRAGQGIADLVKQWLTHPFFLHSKGRLVREDDIAILVRKRSEFSEALRLALEAHGLNVQGLGGSSFYEDPSVEHLLALTRFARLPVDDLALAEVLKGPFGRGPWGEITDSFLEAMGRGRKKQSLWRRFLRYAEGNKAWEPLVLWLMRVIENAQNYGPEKFYKVLYQQGALNMLKGIYGAGALGALFRFDSAVEAWCGLHPFASLEYLVEKMQQRAIPEIAPDGNAEEGIRLMTIHGAKGLQAPVVILADAHGADPTFSWLDTTKDTLAFLPPGVSKTTDTRKLEREKDFLCVVYVALTRAEERLHIIGRERKGGARNSAYTYVKEALLALQDAHTCQMILPGPCGWEGEGVYVRTSDAPPRNA